MTSKPHSELRDKAWSRIDTTKTQDMVPASELRRWLLNYCDLFEQLEASQLAFRVLAECAWSYYSVSPPTENRKEWYVVIDGTALVDEKSAEAVEFFLDPLIAELAAAESNPAKRSSDEG